MAADFSCKFSLMDSVSNLAGDELGGTGEIGCTMGLGYRDV